MSAKTTAKMPPFDFSKPAGEPAFLGPDSVAWRIYKNPIALGIGGVAAVLMEFAEPRIRTGVWDHSIYKTDPIGRSERTCRVALLGVYGPKDAARRVIEGVNRMHARVSGETPAGQAYQALDQELLDWVSATAGYGFLMAYHRFVARLSAAEQSLFLAEGAPVAALYGVKTRPASVAEFESMMHRLAPAFEPHPIVSEFLDIIRSGRAAPGIPVFLHRALARAAVSILPPLIRERLKLGRDHDLTLLDRIALRVIARKAERTCDPESPPAQACVRLGLPGDFLYRPPREQRRLLETLAPAARPALAA
jgi:uncharacterized protein (DUF2236 family)